MIYRLCRYGIGILSLTVTMPSAASAQQKPGPSNHSILIEKDSLLTSGVKEPDVRLVYQAAKETAGLTQRLLCRTKAAHEETRGAEHHTDTGDAGTRPERSRAPRARQTVLPILGEEAEAKGHVLPFAFGIMPGFYSGRRHISVTDSQVTIKRMTVAADGLTNIKVKSKELNWSVRLDAWLFPFLSIYGLIGYTREDADAGVAAPPLNQLRRLLGKKPVDLLDIYMDLTGATYGAGFTLVGGYKNFFATYDANYTISALRGDLPFDNTLSPDVKAFLNSIRVGWRDRLGGYELAYWLGGTYWNTTNTIKGTPRVPVIGKVKFSVREKTRNPLSAHIGTKIELSPSFQLVLDMGSNFSGLFAIAPTVMYRFE